MKRLLTLLSVFLYVAILAAHIYTRRPWNDEAMFHIPASNLIDHGFMGVTSLELIGSGLEGLDKHIYMIFPGNIVLMAGWFKIVGSGLFSVRALSAIAGIGFFAASFFLLRKLTGNQNLAWLATALTALDYQIMVGSTFGRYDILVAFLGTAAYASFVCLREENFNKAILISETLICMAGMCHPNGLIYFLGLIFLIFYYDRHRLGIKQVMIAAIPYLIGSSAWAWWILQSPTDFTLQMRTNGSGRFALFTPITAIIDEVTRFTVAFGFSPYRTGGFVGPAQLKVVALIAYIFGLVWVVSNRSSRSQIGTRTILWLFAIHMAFLTFVDGFKFYFYLIHVMFFFCTFLAIACYSLWQEAQIPKWMIASCLAVVVSINVAGILLRIKADTYHKVYLPAVSWVEQNAANNDLVMGSMEFGFAYGFRPNFIDDMRWGYYSGKRPQILIVEESYKNDFEGWLESEPKLGQYMKRLLNDEYALRFENVGYKIYQRKIAGK